LFANIILADEINRTSPKTQSALLEAMQEFSVTTVAPPIRLKNPSLFSPPKSNRAGGYFSVA